MKFIAANSDLFKKVEFKQEFEAELSRLIKAQGHDQSHIDFMLNHYQNDYTEYLVPDQISANKLASFYFAKNAEYLENHFFDEIDQDLFEVTARGHD